MKRLLCGFILGMMLTPYMGRTHAQDHAAHELTVREILETLADFDIRHESEAPYARPAYGVTVFDVNPPTIYVFNSQTHYSKMSTLLHEFVHVRCAKLGVTCDEEYVGTEETREYQQIFGVQP